MIGGFRIESFVGAGAMAVVYRAVQVNLDRPVALKILPRDFSRSRDYVDRFFNEARAAAAFSHPNIVRAYDAGIDENNVCYFAMEFVEGETLLDRILRDGRVPLLDAIHIALDIAQALDYGWKEHRLLHGDIKPANLMTNTRGETKLADFGLAKVAGGEEIAGATMLTPLYAAPEVIQGYQPKEDCRPDIYSFGATLYHLLAGSPPFPGEDSKEVMRLQVEAPLTPLHQRLPDIPWRVSDFVSALLRKAPDKRTQSWEEVVAGLKLLTTELARNGTVTIARASATGTGKPAAASGKAGTKSRSRAATTHHQPPGNNLLIAGLAAAAVLLAVAVIVALLFAANRRPATRGAKPRPTPEATTPEAKATAIDQQWQHLVDRLARENDPPNRLAILDEFARRGHAGSDLARFRALVRHHRAELEDYRRQQREAARLAAPDPVEQAKFMPPDEPPPDKPVELSPTELATRDRRRADAYTELMAAVKNYRLALLAPPAAVHQQARNWLATFPDDGGETARVNFLVNVMLPAYAHLQPLLIANSDKLAGGKLPGLDDLLRQITAAGIATTVTLDGGVGKVERLLPWREVGDETFVRHFARQLIAVPTIGEPELRAVLACMVFDGAATHVQALVDRLPEAEGRLWLLLARDAEAAPREKAALDQLEAARTTTAAGEYLAAWTTLQALRQTPSTVRQRHEAEIAALVERCQPFTPEARLAALNAAAEAMVTTQPRTALGKCVVGLGRYGRLDSPLRANLRALADQAIQHLAKEIDTTDPRITFHWEFLPFHSASPRRYGRALAAFECFAAQNQLPAAASQFGDVFRAVAWIEAGDWRRGADQFVNLARNDALDLPANSRVAFAYADALLALRFQPRSAELDARLLALHDGFSKGRSQNLAAGTLALDYAMLAERYETARRLDWNLADQPLGEGSPLTRHALARVALELAGGDPATALTMTMQTIRQMPVDSPDARPSTFENLAFLQWLAARLGAPPEGELRWLARPTLAGLAHPEAALSIIHLLELGNRLPEADAKLARQLLDGFASPATPIGAKLVVDRLLLALATHLQAGNVEAMIAAIDAALAQEAPALTEHYPRLLALRAGVQMLRRQPRAAGETLSMLEMASMTADSETKWAKFMTWPVANRTTTVNFADANLDRHEAFWRAYLCCCFWFGTGQPAKAEAEAKTMQRLSPDPSKIRFAASLANWRPPATP